MRGDGRPLRFVALVISAWIAGRIWMLAPLYPPASLDKNAQQVAVISLTSAKMRNEPASTMPHAAAVKASGAAPWIVTAPRQTGGAQPEPAPTLGWQTVALDAVLSANLGYYRRKVTLAGYASGDATGSGNGLSAVQQGELLASFPAGKLPTSDTARWSGSAWAFWRPATGATGTAGGGQLSPTLGGSQAGLRIDWRPFANAPRDLALYGRLSSALARPAAAEAAVGIGLKPIDTVPVRIAVEQRLAASPGGRTAAAAYVAGGGANRIAAVGIDAEAYVQAGVVGLTRRDAFVDGALSATRDVAQLSTDSRVSVGAALSGGAQPGAARVDIAPLARIRFTPDGSGTHFRLQAEWRTRVAGTAQPKSGLAITFSTDF